MAKSRTRAAPRCSACGEDGHTKRSPTCPKKGSSGAVVPPPELAPTPEGKNWSRVSTPAAPLIVFEDLGALEGVLAGEDSNVSVAGAYVKVAPALRPSEREGIDLAALRKSLEERGALGIAWEPRAVAESRTEAKEAPEVVDPREAIRGWFKRQVGVDEETRAAGLELCLRFAEEEGI